MFSVTCALLVFVASVSALAPLLHTSGKKVEDSYTVVFFDNTTQEQLDAAFDYFEQTHSVVYQYKYQYALKGFGANLTPQQLLQVRLHSAVNFVEEDQKVYALQGCNTQTGADWGLVRIAQRTLNIDGRYPNPSTGASNVDAYIIDTGILLTHTDFGGRATFGFKANNQWPSTDDQGHGTHVASTVGGTRYGVAKQVQLIAVKVLGADGSGTTNGVIAGVDFTVRSRQSRGRPSVGNMSLGGARSTALNNAVNRASTGGVLMVVAAGNENNNACNTSPASATNVITVGATDRNDYRSTFSNYGNCVHVFAPGTNILGAWIGGNSASRTISGTSMASPHVCGLAALRVSQNGGLTLGALRTAISSSATPDALDLRCGNAACNQSPNRLAYGPCPLTM